MTIPFAVIRDSSADAAVIKGAVIAVGNFDGVHRGHRAVIDAALAMARAADRPALALTFEPHPRVFFRPKDPQFLLTDERSKLRLLAATGLDGAVLLTFDAARAATPAQDFIARDLVGRLGVGGVAVGYDFHFGKGRTGTPVMLREEGGRRGFPVHIEPRLAVGEFTVSSGAIRDALTQGHVERAATLLGYPWFVTGGVRHGEKRGRELGYPTANIALDPACGLRHGIYAVRIGHGDKRFDGVASFGRRPTFDNGAPLLEVFLFDFAGDLYGATLDIAFIAFIREERKFDAVEALVTQMDADCAEARAMLRAQPDAFPTLADIAV